MACGGRLASVADRAGVARRPLVGRVGEMDAVTGLVQWAARGEAGALLISGEAGVGKTALVREVSAQVGCGCRRAVGAVSAVDFAGSAVPAPDLGAACVGRRPHGANAGARRVRWRRSDRVRRMAG